MGDNKIGILSTNFRNTAFVYWKSQMWAPAIKLIYVSYYI